MHKTVSKVLKTRYFSYSAFWSTCQWEGGLYPPPPPPLATLLVGTDANAHHAIWGSSNRNSRGEDLLEYCASADLNFCNEGNKPTFKTKTRVEVLDLTVVNRSAWYRVVCWYVSNVPSFSHQLYLKIQA